MNAGKIYGEKVIREQHKNAMSDIEQIVEVTFHETAAVWLLTSYLKTHPNKMNKACRTLLEKQGWTHKRMFSYGPLHMDIPVLAD